MSDIAYAAFLRALNVGGRTATMADIAAAFVAADMADVRTFLASGNVLFRTEPLTIEHIEARLTEVLSERLGFNAPVIVRTRQDLATISEMWPFAGEQFDANPTNCIGFAKRLLTDETDEVLQTIGAGEDTLVRLGNVIYWSSELPQSKPSFTLIKLEKRLRNTLTFRNRNTVDRLLKLKP